MTKQRTRVLVASQVGHLAVVQALLQQVGKGSMDVNILSLSNIDSNMSAAKSSSLSSSSAASFLAAIHQRQAQFGETALYVACEQGHASIMQVLLRRS